MKRTLAIFMLLLIVVATIALLFPGSLLIYLVALGFTIWIAGPVLLACCVKIAFDAPREKDFSLALRLLKFVLIALAVLWGGVHLGNPLALRQIDSAKAYAVDLLPLLESFYRQSGAYPESLTEITQQRCPKRLHYCAQGDVFEFTIKVPRSSTGWWVCSSEFGQWGGEDSYEPCWFK